jgi:hypothetical protein
MPSSAAEALARTGSDANAPATSSNWSSISRGDAVDGADESTLAAADHAQRGYDADLRPRCLPL